MISFFIDSPIKLVETLVNLHLENGLTQEQAEKSAIVTLQTMLICGVYPYAHSIVKRAENILLKKMGLPLRKF